MSIHSENASPCCCQVLEARLESAGSVPSAARIATVAAYIKVIQARMSLYNEVSNTWSVPEHARACLQELCSGFCVLSLACSHVCPCKQMAPAQATTLPVLFWSGCVQDVSLPKGKATGGAILTEAAAGAAKALKALDTAQQNVYAAELANPNSAAYIWTLKH
eukprot:scaffold179712_cov23-Tisochrysis_lutea.AAC.2